MDEQAWLQEASAAWRFIMSHVRAFMVALPSRIMLAYRLGRRLLALSQPRLWRFALLSIAVAASVLIADGASISLGLLTMEALATICALAGWAVLRACKPMPLPREDMVLFGSGVSLLVVAMLVTLPLLARASAPTLAFGALALALIAVDLTVTSQHGRAIHDALIVLLIARRVVAPILLGMGLLTVTALTQGVTPNVTLWLLGVALSLLIFAAIQARAMVEDDGVHEEKAPPWRRPLPLLVGALSLAGALVVGAALPAGAPHGMLLALGVLPMALVAVTGLWRSKFPPARVWAARRASAVFTFVALALTTGALASALFAAVSAALVRALGG